MITNFNDYIKENFQLFEKSSLSKLDLDLFIIKNIQKDFALSVYADWLKVNTKRQLVDNITNEQKTLIIQISSNTIKVLVSAIENSKKIYIIDTYINTVSDWEQDWIKLKRKILTKTEFISEINISNKCYLLTKGDYKLLLKSERMLLKDEQQFNEFTTKFKQYIIDNFNNIVNRLYKNKSETIKNQIAKNIEKTSNLNINQIKQILNVNKDLQKQAIHYTKLQNIKDPFNINGVGTGDSLSILDKKILEFEESYTSYFNEYLNIMELSEYFGKDKIITNFLYFLYSGKIYEEKI